MNYQAVKKTRLRAENRLAAYLLDDTGEADGDAGEGDLAGHVADTVTITAAARTATTPAAPSRSVIEPAAGAAKKSRPRVSPTGPESGVQGCGRKPATPAPQTPATSTPEVPRCA
ncbi:hypothetical protein [Saccharopolyspora phatthalungensis]|uniref:Uncharacterized protein n=1 Tax=Saccharopolyspora phatthalungensis TaxID=664693 RepID=A0A840Q031_9PSEU|nr:hypothetical protein [Saccharopolyspora phatthalungensis]MBB5155892.1 hypothetical protein [Saccharopolyspora phatthalungensis]